MDPYNFNRVEASSQPAQYDIDEAEQPDPGPEEHDRQEPEAIPSTSSAKKTAPKTPRKSSRNAPARPDVSNYTDPDMDDCPVTGAITKLLAKPVLRNPEVRDKTTGLKLDRACNMESYLGQARGVAHMNHPCTHCAKGSGKYTVCVTVGGMFSASCCNCHYNNEGVRCSLRPKPTKESVAASIRAAEASMSLPDLPTLNSGPKSGSVPSNKRRRLAPDLISGSVTDPFATPVRSAPPPLTYTGPRGPVLTTPAVTGPSGRPRLTEADRMEAIATHFRALSELYDEQAQVLRER